MKREHLLDAIGGIDDQFLQEAERTAPSSKATIRRIGLVAAIFAVLGITAAAGSGLFSRPIEDSGVVIGETVAPFDMDPEGNIIPGGVIGQKVTMSVAVDPDAPKHLEAIYQLDLPASWKSAGGGSSGSRYELYTWERCWETEGKPGRLRLTQSVTTNYVLGVEGKDCVDRLVGLPSGTQLTLEPVSMAGLSMLKLTIPALPGYDETQGHNYCAGGETRLYWCDGKYLLQLDYPYWVTDAEAEALLQDLTVEPYATPYPEGYGTVNMERLNALKPALDILPGEVGTTVANNVMSAGSFVYSDGAIYYGDTGAICRYDLTEKKTTKYVLSNQSTHPIHLFTTPDYIGYLNSYGDLYLQPKDSSLPEQVVYEGIFSARLHPAGMKLYTTGGIIDLSTGSITSYEKDVLSYYLDNDTLYLLPGDDLHGFYRGNTDATELETVPLSFYPIAMVAEGEDLYFCEGGEGLSYQVIHYKNGVETRLPIRSYYFQVLGGYLVYKDENENGALKRYHLETGSIETIAENVYDFSILENRYICCTRYNAPNAVYDWQTDTFFTLE